MTVFNRIEMSVAGHYFITKRCHCELCGKYLRRTKKFEEGTPRDVMTEYRRQDEVCHPCADRFWRQHRKER